MDPDEFKSPRPVWPIRMLDRAADRAVQRHRAGRAAADEHPGRTFTQGERIANWVTHGLGLAVSAPGLRASRRLGEPLRRRLARRQLQRLRPHADPPQHDLRAVLRLALRGGEAALPEARPGLGLPPDRGDLHALPAREPAGALGMDPLRRRLGAVPPGAVFQFIVGNRYRVTSTVATLFVGWMVVVAIKPLVAAVPHGGLWLLLAGGLCYTAGAVWPRSGACATTIAFTERLPDRRKHLPPPRGAPLRAAPAHLDGPLRREMRFRSNNCVAIHLTSLAKAERFYSDVLGFKLKSKTRSYLEYDTGHFLLYVNRSRRRSRRRPRSASRASPRRGAPEGGPVQDPRGPRQLALFPDPFGNVFDVIED
jgi:hypothetical protein